VDVANEIRSLSNFKQNTSELLARLKKTLNPLVLTINGKVEVVILAVEAYQALLDRVETIEGIQRGLGDAKAGCTNRARRVFNRLRSKHRIPR
jgi:PHD/YefM family antitoxin component YafN of YafNO toxin-antitoxin module